ncbi:hypothetical protein E2C01_063682 [Portunus trituberculatus]|uniref:Uncharacterized protein n=1 Tax=Portunus trituberculatus TaxID=210409 RepID=A0A5B7HJN9_PORTR|nr:hypothetical protein [Portunus trituberculatus]
MKKKKEEKKKKGLLVSEGRGKPKLVVNTEISKDGDLCERVEEQNVLHFES